MVVGGEHGDCSVVPSHSDCHLCFFLLLSFDSKLSLSLSFSNQAFSFYASVKKRVKKKKTSLVLVLVCSLLAAAQGTSRIASWTGLLESCYSP